MYKGQVSLNTDISQWALDPAVLLNPGPEAHWLESHEQFSPSILLLCV